MCVPGPCRVGTAKRRLRTIKRRLRVVTDTGGLLSQRGQAAGFLSRASEAVPSGTCGASAAVFALLGADLCLTLERVVALVAELRRAPEEVVAFDVLQALGFSLPALQRMLSLVEAERRALATGASLSVGHAAHLTGFGWGVLCYGVHRWWRHGRVARLRRRSGADGGRRLGSA